MYDISSVATYYFRKSGFKSVNSKKLPEIAKVCEELCIHFLCEEVSMLFLLQVLFFPDSSTYLLIFRFLIKKSTTLLTMYFKYKTALQPYNLNYLLCLDQATNWHHQICQDVSIRRLCTSELSQFCVFESPTGRIEAHFTYFLPVGR